MAVKRWLSGLAATLVLLSGSAAAQSSSAPRNTAGGITLTPFLQQISVQPSDVAKTFDLILTNHTAGLQELDLRTQDFGSLNDTGGILLEGANASYAQKYGLASWLSLETDTVVLNPGETRSVLVTINNRPDLQPGGHYGAIAVTVNSLTDQSGNRVVINQQLLSLVFVDKVGGEHYNLRLNSITPNGNWFHLPNVVKLRFQNPGNVHVIPRGLVTLQAPGGKVVAKGIINSESALILPETFREVYVPLTVSGHSVPWPGLYHVVVAYRYDQISQAATKTATVRFADLGLYGLMAIIVLVGTWYWKRRQPIKKSSKRPAQSSAKKSSKTA